MNGVKAGDTVTVSAVATYDNASIGTNKTITVVYTLGGVDASKYTAPANTVINNGEITAVPLTGVSPITGTAQVGQTLTAGTITPSGATVSYQWQNASTPGGTFTDINGATNNTYVVDATDETKIIRLVVTGTGTYSGTEISAETSAVTPQ